MQGGCCEPAAHFAAMETAGGAGFSERHASFVVLPLFHRHFFEGASSSRLVAVFQQQCGACQQASAVDIQRVQATCRGRTVASSDLLQSQGSRKGV